MRGRTPRPGETWLLIVALALPATSIPFVEAKSKCYNNLCLETAIPNRSPLEF